MFQIHDSIEAPNSPDFRFSDAWREKDYWLEDGIKAGEIEPQLVLQSDVQDNYSSYSLPLWKPCPSKVDVQPLLPLGHRCSDLSPSSRTQAIANGREEMMEMIRDLPESSYELSLKDIVDLQISREAKAESPIEEEPGFSLNSQQVKPKKKMSKITKSDSMDDSAYLIKTFFPSSSMSKRKLVPWNISRIIPSSSTIIGSQRPKDKKHWIEKPAKETGLPTNSINKFRHEDDKHETGCWPSLRGRKSWTWRKNGFLFR